MSSAAISSSRTRPLIFSRGATASARLARFLAELRLFGRRRSRCQANDQSVGQAHVVGERVLGQEIVLLVEGGELGPGRTLIAVGQPQHDAAGKGEIPSAVAVPDRGDN